MARTAKKSTKKVENKEVSAAIKAFKSSEEVEGLYSFIYENGLREEARKLMEVVFKTNYSC